LYEVDHDGDDGDGDGEDNFIEEWFASTATTITMATPCARPDHERDDDSFDGDQATMIVCFI
jgi:hypothetical protein